MTNSSPLAWLHEQYSGKPWYHSVGTDKYGRHVVYIKYSCMETLKDIVDQVDGKQVMVHFGSYAEASREKFCEVLKPRFQAAPEPESPSEEEKELAFLEMEIFALKRICGEDNLVDILYEIHEKTTGQVNLHLTNVSKEFPEARVRLEKLYDKFGCDVLFNEIE